MNIREYHPVDPAYRALIEERLSVIEKKHNVEIIYACESGSRAWGFASPDSDYDVRFIYVRKPLEYLTIGESTDHIQAGDDGIIDINGWDIKKALGLLHKGNPTLIEWMRSPIVYRSLLAGGTLRNTAASSFNPVAAIHHYYNMGLNTFSTHLMGAKARPKKYFYALRSALAVEWVLRNGTMPPVPMSNLLNSSKLIPQASPLREAIVQLHEEKISTPELHERQHVKVIQDFLVDYYTKQKRADTSGMKHEAELTRQDYDALLRSIVFA